MPRQEQQAASDKPRAWVQALFLDIPFVVDSIWRWGEFNGSNHGKVALEADAAGRHEFKVRALRRTPVFLLFMVISACLVFGPTFDSLCTGLGLDGANLVRKVLGGFLGLVTLRLFLYLLGEVFKCVASRAAHQLRKDTPPDLVEKETVESKITLGEVRERMTRSIIGAGRFFKVAVVCLRNVFSLKGQLFVRVVLALLGLAVGAVLALFPLGFATWVLLGQSYDPAICKYDAGNAYSVYAQIVALLLLYVFMWFAWGSRGPKRGWLQLALASIGCLVVVAVLYFGFVPEGESEASGGVYRQTYALLLAGLVLVAFLMYFVALLSFRAIDPAVSGILRGRLAACELFVNDRDDPPISCFRVWSAFLNGVIYHPLHLLLVPSLVCIMSPSGNQWAFASIAAGIAALVLTYGSLAVRWEQMVLYVKRWFLSGTPLLISLLVIALALMRLMEVQYVSTVLDAAPFGVIFVSVILAYVTFWMFEYWVNRWLAERLLGVLGAQNGADGYMEYLYARAPGGPISVSRDGQRLAIHGTGRMCVQGWFRRTQHEEWERPVSRAFHTYGLMEVFEQLAHGDRDATHAAREVNRRVRFYFGVANLALLALLIGLLKWQDNWERPLASFKVVSANAEAVPEAGHGDLAALLKDRAGKKRPAIIIAASGGGTRAALYTATALEGLSRLGRTEDIVLLSGVSGGGVSVAYFASRYDVLRRPHDSIISEWNTFRNVVTEPFIQDVLEGVGELRVAKDVPVGQLLVESLSRRAFDRENPKAPMRTFASIGKLPLILNTTISGHPSTESTLLEGRVGVVSDLDECLRKSYPFASLAGSRLIFTNLSDAGGFPGSDSEMPDVRMDYRVVRDPDVPLAAAAALNANFPPVFSNARVRLKTDKIPNCEAHSYYVTDGGATENLGLVSALYALRHTIDGLQGVDPGLDIHIVAIEASAVTYDYSQDRGVGAATGGSKERINGGLTEELIDSINLKLKSKGLKPLTVHYLPLPTAFRSRGGFGTHWMYAKQIRVSNPLLTVLPGRIGQFWGKLAGGKLYYVVLEQDDVADLWHAMYAIDRGFCERKFDSADRRIAANWICGRDRDGKQVAGKDWQVEEWNKLVTNLGPSATAEKLTPEQSDAAAREGPKKAE